MLFLIFLHQKKTKHNISVNFLATPYCLSYIKNRVILENCIFMKFPFLTNNKSYSNYLKENGESIKRTKDSSGMASLMKNKGQDWEKLLWAPSDLTVSPSCLLFCICSNPFLCKPLLSLFSWQKAAICGSQFCLFSVQETSRHSLVSLKGQNFQMNKSDCSISGVCRHPFHSSPIGQNLFIWPHLKDAGLCGL